VNADYDARFEEAKMKSSIFRTLLATPTLNGMFASDNAAKPKKNTM